MSTIIQKAVKGQRKAMEFLYKANKQKVYYVSLCLLGEPKYAVEATLWTFKNVWSNITAHNITDEDEFTHLAIRKAVDYCKKKIIEKNPNAFDLPDNHNFLINKDKTISYNSKYTVKYVLNHLPDLQRFIFVLHTAGKYTPEQLASTFKFDMEMVNFALETEKNNIDNIVFHLEENNQSYESVIKTICSDEQNTKVPSIVDEHTATVINNIAFPIEKKKRKTVIFVSVIAVTLCLCIIGGIFSFHT